MVYLVFIEELSMDQFQSRLVLDAHGASIFLSKVRILWNADVHSHFEAQLLLAFLIENQFQLVHSEWALEVDVEMVKVVDFVYLSQVLRDEQTLAHVLLVEQEVGSVAAELALCCLLSDFSERHEASIEHALEDSIFVLEIYLSREVVSAIGELLEANILRDGTDQDLLNIIKLLCRKIAHAQLQNIDDLRFLCVLDQESLDLFGYELKDHLLEELIEYCFLAFHFSWINQAEEDLEHLHLFNLVYFEQAVFKEILDKANAQVFHQEFFQSFLVGGFPLFEDGVDQSQMINTN